MNIRNMVYGTKYTNNILLTELVCFALYKYKTFHLKNISDLFKINSDTGNLDCVAIDREASIISNMYLPQFTVTLRLHDDNMENNRRKRSLLSEYSTEERTWVYIEDDLPNLDNQTVVFVVIDDINDNAPVFINVKQAIGYPTFELALEIFPPYVTVVEVN